MTNGHVDHGQPDAHENQHGGELHALGEGADDERRGDHGEGHLKCYEYRLRYGAAEGIHRDAGKEHLVETTDESIGGAAVFEGQAVTPECPQDAHQGGDGEALHEHREHVLTAHHAGVKKRETRDGHEQHQGRGDEHPRGVAAVEGLFGHGQ